MKGVLVLEKIPLQLRKALYVVPLAFLWVPGLTWEQDASALQVARRSMVASFFYLLWVLLTALLGQLLAFLPETAHAWTLYFMHIAGIVLYGVSLIAAISGKGSQLLDNAAQKFEDIFS